MITAEICSILQVLGAVILYLIWLIIFISPFIRPHIISKKGPNVKIIFGYGKA
jgi:hypothetical protein